MMLLSFFFKASAAKKLYWCLGISTLALIVTIISTKTPNDLRVRAKPSSEILQKSTDLKASQSTVSHFESKVPENRSLPTLSYPDYVSLNDTAFGIYILLDNASLGSGNTDNQWNSLSHSISSSCRYVQRLCVRFLVNKSDSKRTDLRQFIARYINISSVLCEELGTSTEFRTVEFDDLRKGARTLTQLMSSDYVDKRIAYFSVVFIPNTEYRAFPDQLQLLLRKSSDGVGLVVDYAQNSTLPSSLFFSKTHGEIFGWFLPPFLSDIKLAVTYALHVYPANLVFTLSSKSVNSSVEGIKDSNSSGFTSAGLWALSLDQDTLYRYRLIIL